MKLLIVFMCFMMVAYGAPECLWSKCALLDLVNCPTGYKETEKFEQCEGLLEWRKWCCKI